MPLGRSRDVRRADRVLALRHRRHRQCFGRGGGTGGDAHSWHAQVAHAPHHSAGALERRGARAARLTSLGGGESRNETETHAGECQARGLFQSRLGTGKIRGVYLDGRVGEAAALQPLLAPLTDLGAATISPHSIGVSDHVSFEEAGVPGFAFIRDFMETSGGPNHTNMDVYDRMLPAGLEQAAVVTATLAYELAQEMEPSPRN
jgi:hypothetical protein